MDPYYSQEFGPNMNYFEKSRELTPQYSGQYSEMGQYYPKPLDDRRPYYPEPLLERGPYYPESYNERGPSNGMGPSYSVPFSGFNSSLSRYNDGNRAMQPNYSMDDTYSIVPSVVGRQYMGPNEHEDDYYHPPSIQPSMRKMPVHLRLKRGKVMKASSAPIAKKPIPGTVMKRLGSAKREMDDGAAKNGGSVVKKQKLTGTSSEAEGKKVNSIEETDVKSIQKEDSAEASKVPDVQGKEIEGVAEVQVKEVAKVQVKEVAKVQVKEVSKALPNKVKITKRGKIMLERLTDDEAPSALYCHMCDQGSFSTIRSYQEHLQGIKHREISRSFHDANQAALNSLRQKANLACLRHANPTLMGPPNKICDLCFVAVTEGFRTHNKLIEHIDIVNFLRNRCCGRNYAQREQYEEHRLTLPHLMRVYREKESKSDETKPITNNAERNNTYFKDIINQLKMKNGGEKYLAGFDGKTMLGINSLESREVAYCKTCRVELPLDLNSLEEHLVSESHFDSLPKNVPPPVKTVKNESKLNQVFDTTPAKKETKLITKFMRERDDSDSEEEDDEDSGNELLNYIMNAGESDNELEAEVAEATTNEASEDKDEEVTTNGLLPEKGAE